MKKVLALGAATVCALGIMGGAFAAEETSIEALYDVDESYTVTFPAEIEFDDYEDDQTATVKAEDVLLNDGNKLKITMVSTNGALKNGSLSSITYTMKNGEGEKQTIVAGTPFDILAIESGDRDGDTATLTFTSGDDTNVTLAGKHSDTLTFKVEIDDGTVKITDARDGKKYSTAEIAGKTWMTQNLAYVPEDYVDFETDGIYVDEDSGEVYYSWEAANDEGTCPEGWELPSETDFESLDALYDKDTILSKPFNAVRAGYFDSGQLYGVNEDGRYWTTYVDEDNAVYSLWIHDYGMGVMHDNKTSGYTVRCVATE